MRWSIVNAEAPDRSAPSKQQKGWFNEAPKQNENTETTSYKALLAICSGCGLCVVVRGTSRCPLRAFDPGGMRTVGGGSVFKFGSRRCGDADRRHQRSR